MRKDQKDRYMVSDGFACPGCGANPDSWSCLDIELKTLAGAPGATRKWECCCGERWIETVIENSLNEVKGVDDG